jgi:FkbM family methyltransferase
MLGFRGHIISFEPTPDLYDKLAAWSRRHPNWHTSDLALGSKPGEMTLNVMARSVLNSFHEPSTEDTTNFDPVNRVVDRVKVKVETLNNILPDLQRRYGFKRPFLKMDARPRPRRV